MRTVRPLLLLTLVIAATSGWAQSLRPRKAIPADLDAYVQQFHRAHDFNGVVLLAQGDHMLLRKTYGNVAPDSRRPVRPGTVFRIASLSKTFTAGAIEILNEQGRLALDDPLSKFLPDFPNADKITIKQLLLHRSGIGNLVAADVLTHCFTTDQLVARIAQLPPQFPPGTSDNYSNEGYVLLAAVIEKASGQSYGEFLSRQIFQPLGMKHSGVMCTEWPVKDHATGAIAGLGDSLMPLPFEEAGWDGPGSVYSTAGDLLLWLKALSSDRLMHFSALKYPFGWGARDYSKHPLVEQTGQLEGYTSHMALYTREKLFFVMLSNVESGFFDRTPRDLDRILFGGSPSKPPDVRIVPLDARAASDIPGDYFIAGFPIPLRFVAQRGTLYLHWGDDPFLRPLIPTSDGFFERAEYGTFHFERGKDGAVTGVTATFGDGDPMHLSRKPSH